MDLSVEPLDAADAGLPQVYDEEAITAYWSARPVEVARRLAEITSTLVPFVASVAAASAWPGGGANEAQVRARAARLRELLTALGPTFIKIGQWLAVRPDLVGPATMQELQQLHDAVPPFPTAVAMRMIEQQLGRPLSQVFVGISAEPLAAASLGQVYQARLAANPRQLVAVKVQRPDMLRHVSLDLYCIRRLAGTAQRVQNLFTANRTDFVALFRQWARGMYLELDYVNEGHNAGRFERLLRSALRDEPAERRALPIQVPRVFFEYTSRKVLTTEWIVGTKLADAAPAEVARLVNVGVECFLRQLLQTGFFHADPHPGNLMATRDGRLAVLDYGLMAEIEPRQMDSMVASIIHLANRDFDAVFDDFIALQFLPDTPAVQQNRARVVSVLGAILNQALEGGGAKSIDFRSLSSDLAAVTFEFPFSIPPYFALIIRALGVLEGIALKADPQFKMVMQALPFVSRRVMTAAGADNPLLQRALREILYGNGTRLKLNRLRTLIGSSQGQLTRGEAFVDFDTPPEGMDAEAMRSALAFVFGREDGRVLRQMLVQEIVDGADALLSPGVRGADIDKLETLRELLQLLQEYAPALVSSVLSERSIPMAVGWPQLPQPPQAAALGVWGQVAPQAAEMARQVAGRLAERFMQRAFAQWRLPSREEDERKEWRQRR